MAHHIDLGIVVVSWNVREHLRRCLRSIDESLGGRRIIYRTIVVDNASHDGSAEMVRGEFPHVEIIANATNRGFAGGNNDGFRALGLLQPVGATRRVPRYVLLLNPDTEVAADALPRLLHYLDRHADVIAVGPQLRYGDGSLQSSRRHFPSIGTLFWESTLLEQWWPGNPWARRYRMETRSPTGEQTVDWLVGAALLVRAAAIERSGGLDEGFFMYSEELEWQARLARDHRREGGRIVYLAGAVVIHHEGRSSEQDLARRQINFNRSKLRYARMHWGAHVALVLRIFLLVCFMLQAAIEAGKWVLGHKRRMRAARVREYVQVLASGL